MERRTGSETEDDWDRKRSRSGRQGDNGGSEHSEIRKVGMSQKKRLLVDTLNAFNEW